MRPLVSIGFCVVAACGSSSAPASPSPAPPEPEPVPVAAASPPNLATCALEPTVIELGEPNDGSPSEPVATAEGFVVVFTRQGADGTSHVWTQRVGFDGTAEPAQLLRSGVHTTRPILLSDGAYAHAAITLADGTSLLVPVRPGVLAATLPVSLPGAPDDVTMSPRGVVSTRVEGEHRIVHRDLDLVSDVELPAPGSWPEPRERILASGPTGDALLLIEGPRRSLVTLDALGVAAAPIELFTAPEGTWGEASIAAGPDGFAVVRTGPGIGDLEVHLASATGIRRVSIPLSAGVVPDSTVRRYPRIAALGSGWLVSYWDGTGPSLVRLDASGAVTNEAIAIRSGDERGGHTDARMTATSEAIAITWLVGPPARGHGFPEEEPRRPGPRMMILRCRP